MNTISKNREKTLYLTTLGLLSALIILLQTVFGAVKLGPVSVTFTLVPIVMGSILLGKDAGAFLGGVFGVIVVIMGLSGADGFTLVLLMNNPVFTVLICLVKGVAAGFFSGLVYELVKGENAVKSGRGFAAAVAAAVIAPVINTGLFILGGLLLVGDIIKDNFAGGSNLIVFLVVVCAGLNFIAEFIINAVLSPAINAVTFATRRAFGGFDEIKRYSAKKRIVLVSVALILVAVLCGVFFARNNETEGVLTVNGNKVSEDIVICQKGLKEYSSIPLFKTLKEIGAEVTSSEEGIFEIKANEKSFTLDLSEGSLSGLMIGSFENSAVKGDEVYVSTSAIGALLDKLGYNWTVNVSYSAKSVTLAPAPEQ